MVRHPQTLDLVKAFVCTDKIERMQWSPDSKYILCQINKQSLTQVFSLDDEDWNCKIDEGLGGLAYARWSPCSRRILTVTDFQVRFSVWSLVDKSVVHIQSPKHFERGLAFSHHQRWAALLKRSNSKDSITIRSCEQKWEEIESFAVAGDCGDLAWGAGDATLLLWERPLRASRLLWYSLHGELLGTLSDMGLIRCVAPSSSFHLIATGSCDGQVTVVSPEVRQPLTTLKHDLRVAVAEYGDGAQVYQEELVGAGPVSKHVHLHGGAVPESAKTGAVRLVLKSGVPQIPTERLGAEPPVDRDGVPRQGVGSLSWSHDERFIVTKHDSMPTAVWVWDLGRLALVAVLLFRTPIKSHAWAPVEKDHNPILAISTGDPVLFFWSPDGAVTAPCSFPSARLQWAPGGKALLLQDREHICVCFVAGLQWSS